jgi:dihydrofolate reductase
VDQLARDRGELIDFVRHPKGRTGGDIGVHACISVTRTLLAADVVDELRLVMAPTIAGSGQRLFDGLSSIRLETIRSASPSGHLLVTFAWSASPTSPEVPTQLEHAHRL